MSYADFPFSTTPYAAEPVENAVIPVTSVSASFALQGVGVSAGGSVTVVAAEDQMDFAIGSVIAESESIVDVTGVSARFNDLARFSYSLDSQTAGFPVLSNTESITGTTSAYFGSTNNEIQIPQEQDVIQSALSANNQFTIEFWYYIETATFAPRFISVQQTTGNSNRQLSIVEYQGQIYVENQQGTRIQAGSVSDQTWTHIAVTADNGTLKLYIDGVLEGTSTGTTFIDAQSEFNIGGTGPFGASDNRFHLDGYMDLFRVSNNVRYTTNFTPPTSAFTVDDNTTIIFNFDGPNGSQDFELLQLPYSSTDIVADADVDVTGIELSTELGTETIAADAVEVPTSVIISSSTGVETVTGTALITPTGVEATVDLGTSIIIANADVSVIGEELNTVLGTEVIIANADVDVTGLEINFAEGTATVEANADVSVTGLEINFAEGTAIVRAGADVSVTGIEIESATGTATAPAAVILTGVSLQFTEGTAEAPGDANVPVTGQVLSFALGKETITGAWGPVNPDASNSYNGVTPGASNSWTEVAA